MRQAVLARSRVTVSSELTGRQILIVEDEYFVANALARLLAQWGAAVVGPVASADKALKFLESRAMLDAAIIDVNLKGIEAFDVADAVLARDALLVLATGYDVTTVPERYRHAAVLQKPCDPADLLKALSPITERQAD
jgi:CheY-like chemotaxis protein